MSTESTDRMREAFDSSYRPPDSGDGCAVPLFILLLCLVGWILKSCGLID
jgi:hypothetical protein